MQIDFNPMNFGKNVFLLVVALQLIGTAEGATVVSVVGRVWIKHYESDENARSAKPGEFVAQGEIINTSSNGGLKLFFDDKTIVDLSKSSLLKIEEYPNDSSRISLLRGQARFVVNKTVEKNGRFSVKTPSAVMTVQGTEFVVAAQSATQTTVTVLQGKVLMDPDPVRSAKGKDQSILLREGEQIITGPSELKVSKLSPEQKHQLLKDSQQSDHSWIRSITFDATSRESGRKTLQGIADDLGAPDDFTPRLIGMRLPGSSGMDLWSFAGASQLNLFQASQVGVSNLKVTFSQ